MQYTVSVFVACVILDTVCWWNYLFL